MRPSSTRSSSALPCATAASSTRRTSTSTLRVDGYRGTGQGAHRNDAGQQVIQIVLGLRPARPGRRRLPHRPEVAALPAAARGQVQKYVCCNADEGDPGAFMDRSRAGGRPPRSIIEAMAIARLCHRGQPGLYLCPGGVPHRGEAPADRHGAGQEYGLLGENIFGTGFSLRPGDPVWARALSSAARRPP